MKAAGGSGSGRIWTESGRMALWLRSGCCSSAGAYLQGTREEVVHCDQSKRMSYTPRVFNDGEEDREGERCSRKCPGLQITQVTFKTLSWKTAEKLLFFLLAQTEAGL
ncbi:hypothetical protein AMECASPLE_031285 [Ameca splendens]|uniref:Uncharacterized protein n=1 Tax=Ameca splendens TaxID=208324 RepID=A0ABV0ZSJ6_9TELE